MDRYFPIRAPAPSDDVSLAIKSINVKADKSKVVEEVKLKGKQYIRCMALTKRQKNIKQRSLPIWKWGEDI